METTNNNWKKYSPSDNPIIGRCCSVITIDTRDMAMHISDCKLELDDDASNDNPNEFCNETIRKILNKEDFPEDYTITENELALLYSKLYALKTKYKQIVMSFDVLNCDQWLKYVRFYKIEGDKYLVTNRQGIPIMWRDLNEDTLIKPYMKEEITDKPAKSCDIYPKWHKSKINDNQYDLPDKTGRYDVVLKVSPNTVLEGIWHGNIWSVGNFDKLPEEIFAWIEKPAPPKFN